MVRGQDIVKKEMVDMLSIKEIKFLFYFKLV